MNNDLIIKPETLNQESDALERARAITITTDEEYSAADAFCVGLLALEKAIKSDFKASKDAAHAAHKAIVFQEAQHLEKVQTARATVKPKLVAYEAEKARLAAEETARLQALSQKIAEDATLNAAAEAEKNGDKETAAAIMEAPVQAVPVVVTSNLKRQTRIPECWTAEPMKEPKDMTDEELRLVAPYLTWNVQAIGALARATKGAVQIPCVRIYDKSANGVH